MFWRLLYSLFWCLALPGVLLYFVYRGIKNPSYFGALCERFCLYPPALIRRLRGRCLHLHCASLGEVNALSSLLPALKKAYPDMPLLVTNSTPAGANKVKELLAADVSQLMAPLDGFIVSQLFVFLLKPKVSLFSEVEIWPNWLAALADGSRPLLLINARLSKKSARRYAKLSAIFKPALQGFNEIYAQDAASARRYRCFNAKVKNLGNLKFVMANKSIGLPKGIHSSFILPNYVWIAGSVHPDELEVIIQAHKKVLQHFPKALLIIVPRHVERFKSTYQTLLAHNLTVARRSLQQQPNTAEQVWLIDSLGELMQFYRLASIAFVGGSLVERGGHNPLEPASLGLPVLMGPSQTNCLSQVAQLHRAGGFKTINTSEQLAAQLLAWWQDKQAYQDAAEAGPNVVQQNNQVLKSALTLLRSHISRQH